MAENVQHVDAASTPQSSSDASRVTQITPTVNKGFLGSLGEYFPHVNDLISSDGKKEIGFLAIVAWHHSIAKLAARQKIPFPPVLLSTIGALLGLTLVREIGGKESSDNLVEYFDPSVDFVGTWMSLWLVPSLVLLPNALRKIEGANKSMWVKLIITHFVLWCGSTVGSAKLYELLESRSTANSSEVNNSISAINSISISSPLVNGMQAGEDNKSPQVTSSESGPESIQGDNDNEISSSSSNGISPVATTNIESGGSVNGPSAAEKAQSEKTKKQLKLLRFWGAITVCFYAAPLHGIIATTAPALGNYMLTPLHFQLFC